MSKHTPGPWRKLGTEVYFANVAGGISLRNCPDAEANARLIAAAPDLLDACETYFNLLRSQVRDGRPPDGEAHYQAQLKMEKAIAKARGES